MSENSICYRCMRPYKKEYGLCPFCGYKNHDKRPEPLLLEPGTVLQNKYLIGEALGYGGFSVTYVGFDLTLQLKIAVKEYLPSEYATRIANQSMITVSQQSDDAAHYMVGIDKFMQEAQRIASLDDIDGIVKVFDAFMENNTAYIVMEYLEGETLSQKLEKEGKLEPQKAFTVLMPLLTSLSKVHEAGILHRDISPDNIFFTKEGTIKLIDFGASRKMPRGKSRSLSVFINPGYTPAEQYTTDGNQGTWTDVYSLAATIYKMITGVTPPDGLQRKSKDSIKPPSKLGVKISRNAENALLNAMNVRVKKRTKTVDEFRQQLYSTKEVKRTFDKGEREYLGGIPVWARITLAAAAVLALGVTIVAASGIMLPEPEPPAALPSLPDGKVYVPRFYSKTIEEAKAEAKKYGLTVEVNDSRLTDDIPVDKVYEQDPLPRTVVDKNATIRLVVSAGPKNLIELPRVHGMTLNDAKKLLETRGFTVEVGSAQESVYGENVVCRESLTDRTIAYVKGRKITLTPSAARQQDDKNKIRMPSFTGGDLSAAEQTAEKENVCLKIVYKTDQAKENQVIAQSIQQGESCSRWVTVTLTVSAGISRDGVVVPYVQAKPRQEAIKTLADKDLAYEIVSQEYNDDYALGSVISQSVESGTVVSKGTTVRLVISLGKKKAAAQSRTASDASASESKKESSQKKVQRSVQTTVQQPYIQTYPQQQTYDPETTQQTPDVSVPAQQESNVRASGSCGRGVTYTLYKDGRMEISGQGEMYEYPDFPDKDKIYSVTVYSGVSNIGAYAFENAGNLQRVTIYRGVTKIGSSAFSQCSRLTGVELPSTLSVIDSRAFWNAGLTGITIPDSVTQIGERTFENCASLQNVTLTANSGLKSIAKAAFGSCSSLQAIHLPDGLRVIPDELFKGCSALSEFSMSDRVTEIGAQAFAGCTALDEIFIPRTVTYIGSSAFYGWKNNQRIDPDNRSSPDNRWAKDWRTGSEAATIEWVAR